MDRNQFLATQAAEILAAAGQEKLIARLLGGMAVYDTYECTRRQPFQREIHDLDFIVTKRSAAGFSKLLPVLGYSGDHQFNSIHGETRMLFISEQTEIDVFIGIFHQCHELNFEHVLSLTKTTIPITHLLLTKLQIFQINRKDQLDALALLHDHEPQAGAGGDGIDLSVLTSITGNDWGWHTTVSDNLESLTGLVDELFTGEEKGLFHRRIGAIQDAMQGAPKSVKWKLREKIGRRVPWYDLPEEKQL